MNRGIATLYRGIEYRSRLEARWAAFFTEIGWEHTYEPFDGDGYIPDFLIHGDNPFLVEVKPAVSREDYREPVAKAESGLAAHWKRDILIVGLSPIMPSPDHRHPWDDPLAGLLGEALLSWGEDPVMDGWCWDDAQWFTCQADTPFSGQCNRVAVFHTLQSFTGRPCGHYEGDNHLAPASRHTIDSAWANACNDVKWRGKAA